MHPVHAVRTADDLQMPAAGRYVNNALREHIALLGLLNLHLADSVQPLCQRLRKTLWHMLNEHNRRIHPPVKSGNHRVKRLRTSGGACQGNDLLSACPCRRHPPARRGGRFRYTRKRCMRCLFLHPLALLIFGIKHGRQHIQ